MFQTVAGLQPTEAEPEALMLAEVYMTAMEGLKALQKVNAEHLQPEQQLELITLAEQPMVVVEAQQLWIQEEVLSLMLQ